MIYDFHSTKSANIHGNLSFVYFFLSVQVGQAKNLLISPLKLILQILDKNPRVLHISQSTQYNVQMYKCTNVQMYKCTYIVQLFLGHNIVLCTVQEHPQGPYTERFVLNNYFRKKFIFVKVFEFRNIVFLKIIFQEGSFTLYFFTLYCQYDIRYRSDNWSHSFS